MDVMVVGLAMNFYRVHVALLVNPSVHPWIVYPSITFLSPKAGSIENIANPEKCQKYETDQRTDGQSLL